MSLCFNIDKEIYYNGRLVTDNNMIKKVLNITIRCKLQLSVIKEFKLIFEKYTHILDVCYDQYDELYKSFKSLYGIRLSYVRNVLDVLSKIDIKFLLELNNINNIIVIKNNPFPKIKCIRITECGNIFIKNTKLEELKIINCKNIYIKNSTISKNLSVCNFKNNINFYTIYLINNDINYVCPNGIGNVFIKNNKIFKLECWNAKKLQFKGINKIHTNIIFYVKYLDGLRNISEVKELKLNYITSIIFNFYKLFGKLEKLDISEVKNSSKEEIKVYYKKEK